MVAAGRADVEASVEPCMAGTGRERGDLGSPDETPCYCMWEFGAGEEKTWTKSAKVRETSDSPSD